MKPLHCVRTLTLLGHSWVCSCWLIRQRRRPRHRSPAKHPLSSRPLLTALNYTRRDVMIPMRDGVKLHTIILVPKGARTRPSSSPARPTMPPISPPTSTAPISVPALRATTTLSKFILEGGYIRVVQDVRGKYGSEGDYVMTARSAALSIPPPWTTPRTPTTR